MDWAPTIRRVIERSAAVLFAVSLVWAVLLVALFFLLGGVCGCSIRGSPYASFDYDVVDRDDRPDALEITHEGGDSLSTEKLYVVANARFRAIDGNVGGHRLTWRELGHSSSNVSAGDSVLIEPAAPGSTIHGATFDVRWWGENTEGELAWLILGRWNRDATPALNSSASDADTPVPSLSPPGDPSVRTPTSTDDGSINESNATTGERRTSERGVVPRHYPER